MDLKNENFAGRKNDWGVMEIIYFDDDVDYTMLISILKHTQKVPQCVLPKLRKYL